MTIKYAGRALERVDEHDMATLHEQFHVLFRGFGLRGAALDFAIADGVRSAVASIEKYRAETERRGSNVRLVVSDQR